MLHGKMMNKMIKKNLRTNVKFQTYTYFLVEGRTSATAPELVLFMLGRFFHVEPPIVKHSTDLIKSF
jgi:hypothetical protein